MANLRRERDEAKALLERHQTKMEGLLRDVNAKIGRLEVKSNSSESKIAQLQSRAQGTPFGFERFPAAPEPRSAQPESNLELKLGMTEERARATETTVNKLEVQLASYEAMVTQARENAQVNAKSVGAMSKQVATLRAKVARQSMLNLSHDEQIKGIVPGTRTSYP